MSTAILINSLTQGGGAERVVSTIAYHVPCRVFCWEKANLKDPDVQRATYLKKYATDASLWLKLCHMPIVAWRLKKYIRQDKIQRIQSHLYRAHMINVWTKFLGGRHSIHMVMTDILAPSLLHPVSKLLRIIQSIKKTCLYWIYRQADCFIFKSWGMQKDFYQKFPRLSHIPYHVIPNPCDSQLVLQKANQKPYTDPIMSRCQYIVFCGRLIPTKRPLDVVQAFLPLMDRYVNWHVLFIGQGSMHNTLSDVIHKKHCQGRMHLLGYQENPFYFMKKSEIFVSASETEGWPNVFIEAMTCKTVIIAADCLAGPREILDKDTSYNHVSTSLKPCAYGLLYPVGQIAFLTQGLDMMMSCHKMRLDYQNKGYQRAQDFHIQSIIPQYRALLS